MTVSTLFPVAPFIAGALLRAFTLGACIALGLVGCGGGGSGTGSSPPPTGPIQQPPGNPPPPVDPPGPPVILEFSSDKAAYFIGERAVLTVRFTGGDGRIEPDLGPVTNGTPVHTGALDGNREYTLVVESAAAGAVRQTLRLSADYRDEYVPVPAVFRSAGHSATLADDGKVVLAGGSRLETTPSYAIDVYDPSSGGFRSIGTLLSGRYGHTATRLVDGRILIAGGAMANHGPWAELINERTGEATGIPEPAQRRLGHAATWLGGGRVLVTGGSVAGEGGAAGDTAEIFDVATGRFRLLASRMSMPRANHSAALMPDGRVLILGGLSGSGRPYELAEVFDPRTETFTAVGSVDNSERSVHATVRLPDGSVLVLGGETYATRPLGTVLRFDGTTLASSALPNLLRPRTMVEGVSSRDGRVFLFGGEVGDEPAATDLAESYSVAQGPAVIASLPQARTGHTSTRLKDGRILIVGGEDRTGTLIDNALIYR